MVDLEGFRSSFSSCLARSCEVLQASLEAEFRRSLSDVEAACRSKLIDSSLNRQLGDDEVCRSLGGAAASGSATECVATHALDEPDSILHAPAVGSLSCTIMSGKEVQQLKCEESCQMEGQASHNDPRRSGLPPMQIRTPDSKTTLSPAESPRNGTERANEESNFGQILKQTVSFARQFSPASNLTLRQEFKKHRADTPVASTTTNKNHRIVERALILEDEMSVARSRLAKDVFQKLHRATSSSSDDEVTASKLHAVLLLHGETEYSVDDVASVLPLLAHKSKNRNVVDDDRMGVQNTLSGHRFVTFQDFAIMMLEGEESEMAATISQKHTIDAIRRAMFSDSQGSDALVAHALLEHVQLHKFLSSSAGFEKTRFQQCVDVVMGFVILMNTILLGVSHDIEWGGWDVIEVVVTVLFVMEMSVRVVLQGWRFTFCGPECRWNLFDLLIVGFSVVDSAIAVMNFSAEEHQHDQTWMDFARTARVVRLTRLFRLGRLVRVPLFRELYMMLNGVVSGARTLFWACVLTMSYVYVCALALAMTHETSFDTSAPEASDATVYLEKYRKQLFGSTWASVFTVFRCITGDCTTPDGYSLTEQMGVVYGAPFILTYFVCTMVMNFGIMNLIMAIFVDNTMQATKFLDVKQRRLRTEEAKFVEQTMLKLVKHLFQAQRHHARMMAVKEPQDWNVCMSRVHLTKQVFDMAIKEPDVQELLDDLTIAEEDREDLFSTFDADGNGKVPLSELITGLMRLRGGPRRSDTVEALMVVRQIQASLQRFETAMGQQFGWIGSSTMLASLSEVNRVRSKSTDTTTTTSDAGLSQEEANVLFPLRRRRMIS